MLLHYMWVKYFYYFPVYLIFYNPTNLFMVSWRWPALRSALGWLGSNILCRRETKAPGSPESNFQTAKSFRFRERFVIYVVFSWKASQTEIRMTICVEILGSGLVNIKPVGACFLLVWERSWTNLFSMKWSRKPGEIGFVWINIYSDVLEVSRWKAHLRH